MAVLLWGLVGERPCIPAMSREGVIAMGDVAMHEQAIGIDDDWRANSRDSSGADPVSVDTCAVQREAYAPHLPAR